MEEQKPIIENKPKAEDEIDLIALAKKLWDGRKTIIICVVVGAVLGVFVALFSPKEYTASSVMVPQLGEGSTKLGGLSGLASMAGFNLNMNQTAELSPTVYPQIINSVPFQLELMNSKFNFEDFKEPISLIDYYTKYKKKDNVLSIVKKYTIGLPFLLLNAIKGEPKEIELPKNIVSNKTLRLNKDQNKVSEKLKEIISLEVNPKEGILTLTSRMPEALVSAQVGEKAQEILQKMIIEFKVEKAKDNLDFIEGRYKETKAEFEKAQYNLALVNDRNKSFTSGIPLLEKDRIQTQYTISYTVFQDLAKQLEQAKIQVKKETPVFTILKPVNVPFEKTKPKRAQILVIGFFIGGVIGVGIIFLKEWIWNLKTSWGNH
jgi:archaellin